MQSRVVGQMEAWRGWQGLERVGRGAVDWFATAWRSGIPEADRAVGRTRNGREGPNRSEGSSAEVPGDSSGSHAVMDEPAAPDVDGRGEDAARPSQDADGLSEEDRVARGTGMEEQAERGASVRAEDRLPVPGQRRSDDQDRRPVVPEQSRVPSWLATGAAWSWRLLLLAAAIYLIARVLGILYIVVVPCTAAILLTALRRRSAWRSGHAGDQPGDRGLPDPGLGHQSHHHAA